MKTKLTFKEQKEIRTFTEKEVVEISLMTAGAATAPFMEKHPQDIMPTEEVLQAVYRVLKEFEIDHGATRK